MSRPWLAVVMPVHHGADWLDATLASVAAERPVGVEILIRDSSTDERSATIAESYIDRLDIRLTRCPEVPSWTAKTNRAVAGARAAHVAMLHQDDVWLPGRVAAMKRWARRDAGAALHLAPTAIIDAGGKHRGLWRCPLPAGVVEPALLRNRLLTQNFVSVPAPLIRHDAWDAAGGLDEGLWYTADWDLWLKLAGVGRVRHHRDVTTGFRVHGGSQTISGSADLADFERQMRIVVDRHAGTERTLADASIRINTALAGAAGGDRRRLVEAAATAVGLGPLGLIRYLRDSRLIERVLPRLRARLAG